MKKLMKNFAILMALFLFLGTVGLDVQAAAAMNDDELLKTESITIDNEEEAETGGDEQLPEELQDPEPGSEEPEEGEPGEGDPDPDEPEEGDLEPVDPEEEAGDPEEELEEEENDYVELFPSPELFFPPAALAGRFALFSNPLLDPGETSFSKTAEPVPGYVNTWKVTLDMSARDTQVSSDIVLVIDASTSMNSGGKLAAAKAAAVQFVEEMLNGTYPNTRIALVRFGTGVDVLLSGSFYGPSAANITTLTNAINGITISGTQYTHTQAAIRQAQILLDGAPSTGQVKNIVLLSDGQPTRSYALYDTDQSSGNFPSSGNPRYNFNNLPASKYNYASTVGTNGNMYTQIGNTNRYYHHGNSAEGQAKMAKDSGKIIYTIALSAGASGTPVLNTIASPGKNYTGSASDMNAIFADIAGSISSAMSAVTVVDNMGPGMEIPAHRVASITTTQGTASYNAVTRTINWNLGGALNKVTGDPTLRYAKLEYIVEINDDILTAPKYDALSGGTPSTTGTFYDTNGITTATYNDAGGHQQTHNYTSPRVDPVFYTVGKTLKDSVGQLYPAGDNRTFVIRVTGPDGYSRDHSVKHGETLTLTSLRRVGTYSVSEISVSGTPASQLSDYNISYQINGVSGSSFAVAQGSADIAIAVTNQEIPLEPVNVTISGTKSLIGRALGNGEFTFNLYNSNASGAQGSLLKTATNVGANFSFAALTFAESDIGTHYYLIKEAPGILGGVQYDGTAYLVKVVVSDGGDGELVAAVTYMVYKVETSKWVTVTGAAFKNTYTATGSFTPSVSKALSGRALNAGEFTFVLEKMTAAGPPATWSVLQTKTNLANGSIPFTAINYTLADVGTHTYQIRELPSGLPGVTDDGLVVNYVVTVSDNGNGTLQVAYGTPNDTVFNNSYAATGSFTPSVTKALSGRDLLANEFNFVLEKMTAAGPPQVWALVESKANLADGTIPFSAINYTLADVGVHTYRIRELPSGLDGVIDDTLVVNYVVTVSDNGNGTLQVTYATPNDTVFNNIYAATGSFTPSVSKALSGRALKADEFNFVLEEKTAEGPPTVWTQIESISNLANGTIPFSAINYTLADVGVHTYRIRELASGLPGVTDDTLVVEYVVTVSDKGDGSLEVSYNTPNDTVFNNAYAAFGSFTPSVTKALTGRALLANEFSFVLEKMTAAGPPIAWALVESKTNLADGTIPFSAINYTLADVGTHTYRITEEASVPAGVIRDLLVVSYTVVVSDNGDGTLKVEYDTPNDTEFNNLYTATGSFTPVVTKALSGRDLLANEFNFVLEKMTDAGPPEVWALVESKGNLADGTIPFSAINYMLADVGVHTYRIREEASGLGGVTDDNLVVSYVVTVADKGDGTLEISYDIPNDTIFNNAYEAEGIDLDLDGIKSLEGRELVDGEFSFSLYESDADGVQGDPIETVSNVGGYFEFSTLTFDDGDEGTYYYLIKEDHTSLGGMIYDLTEFLVKVVIDDDLEGALYIDQLAYMVFDAEEEAWIPVEIIAFYNSYGADSIDLDLDGIKSLEGRELVDGEFSFSLYESDADGVQGDPIETVSNDGGYFEFSTLTFNDGEEGTYYYLIKEDDTGLGGVIYDLTEYLVKVVIDDDLEGALQIEEISYMVFYAEEESEEGGWMPVEGVAFHNSYGAEGIDIDLGGIKNLEGRSLVDGEFSFSLYESDAYGVQGSLIETVTNDGDYFKFSSLTFGHGDEGVFYFLIKEDVGTLSNVTYDLTEYLVRIIVFDDLVGSMQLEELRYMIIGSEEEEGWLESEIAVFNNRYIPPPPPPVLVPDLEVEKLVDETVFSEAGDQLHYSVRITNTGELAFVKLTINDARLGIANLEIDLSADPLLPGETYLHVFTAPYIVTEADVEAAVAIINTLTVKGETAEGREAEDDDEALVPFEQTLPAIPPVLKLEKLAKESKFSKVGNLIHYYFTVTNEGVVAVMKLTVNDPKLGINNLVIDLTDDPLMPGESFTYEFSQVYVVTQADVDAGKIVNVLTVTGESPDGLTDEAKDDLIVPYEQILPLPPTGEYINNWAGIAALLLGGAVALMLIIRRRNLQLQDEDQ